ncbi:MAG: vWA domain-containing protein [Ilumatobacteraceae bacterium]|nr:vWA domain-containing protein [Ilumatobacteraceae bacterium]
MGNGNRSGQVLNFQITANYNMNADDRDRWQRAFSKASELLWNATEGQLRIGTIWVAENNAGANNAEFVLDPDTAGRALGTNGKWGQSGEAIFLPAYAQQQVLSILHEMGHHVWGLKEEYARSEGMWIDTDATLPAGHGNRTIPLTSTSHDEPDANYAGANALLRFEGQPVETIEILSKVGNRITTVSAFTDNPQDCIWEAVTIQWVDDVECTGDRSTGACIMEFSRSSAGDLAPDGTWTPHPQPVTEFCTAANHDPDGDTDQESDLGEPCWETIVAVDGFTNLSSGDPDSSDAANTTMPGGWTAPTWVELDPNVRLALVLDRSGSMNRNSGARLQGVQTGAKFWIENAAVEDDQLTIVWYDNAAAVQLPLVGFGTLSDTAVAAELDTIDNQTAAGGTNIVDGLLDALGQITSPATPASVQAAVLITDGAHNAGGTAVADAVDPYRSANTNIHTLGVGAGAEMDLPGLVELASDTGGTAQTAGEGSDAAAIQAAMIEINAVIRGGMLSTTGSGGGDTKEVDDRLDELARKADDIAPPDRPSLDELIAEFGLLPFEKAVSARGSAPHRYTWFGLEVEKGAQNTTFTLSHGEPATYWMYLIDPSGNEVHPSAGEVVAWNAGPEPYEFAKIERPAAGQWLVIGVRLDRGAAVPSKAIAAIDHREVTVFGEALRHGAGCPVEFRAGARFVEPLTGLTVGARIRRPGGPWHDLRLHDDMLDGVYRGWADLPDGAYSGYIEIRAPERPLIANMQHTLLHADSHDEIGAARADTAGFVRHVPISVVLGPVKDPSGRLPDDEEQGRSDDDPRKPFDPRRWVSPLRSDDRLGLPTKPPVLAPR